uniref:Uncharacterized protein n=1 Tax=Anguilla anguilla TaxID=7936 RepID=A0A0E9QKF4_ANGAN
MYFISISEIEMSFPQRLYRCKSSSLNVVFFVSQQSSVHQSEGGANVACQ